MKRAQTGSITEERQAEKILTPEQLEQQLEEKLEKIRDLEEEKNLLYAIMYTSMGLILSLFSRMVGNALKGYAAVILKVISFVCMLVGTYLLIRSFISPCRSGRS